MPKPRKEDIEILPGEPKSFLCAAENCTSPGTMCDATSGPADSSQDHRRWYCRRHWSLFVQGTRPEKACDDETARDWIEVLKNKMRFLDLTDDKRKTRTNRNMKSGRWTELDEKAFREHMHVLGRGDWL